MSKIVTYIEIDVPMCSREFSVAPCAAAYSDAEMTGLSYDDEGTTLTGLTYDDEGTLLSFNAYDTEGVLGGGECFNSLHTCEDTDNYNETTNAVRFGYPDAEDQSGVDFIPSLLSVSHRPQRISLEGDMGVRGSLTCTFRDHPDSETHNAGDLYRESRGYDPFERGTFWGKWQARHYPKMQGAVIRYIRGTEGQDVSAMDSWTFVIEKITGPDKGGKVSVTAKDILKLADEVKAQCPVLSNGRLLGDITNSATSATLTPTGIGDEEYSASGYVAIGGKEVCSFTRSGDVLTLTRGQFNTDAVAHDQNDIVQLCKGFFDGANGLDPADILYDLLVNYTTIPVSWITLTDWQAKTEQFLGGRLYYTLVAEPTSVNTLIVELLEQAGLILYTDELNRQIRLDAVRELTVEAVTFDEDNIISGSFDNKRQPEKRLSQVWTWYGMRNPLEPLDEHTNYRAAVSHIDTLAESLYGDQPAIKKIYSRWINIRPAGTELCYRLLSRFRDPPRLLQWSAWRFGDNVPALAGRYDVNMWPMQDAEGNNIDVPVQVVKALPGDDSMTIEAQEISWYEYDDQPDQGLLVVVDNDVVDFNFRTEYDKSYAAPESGDTITCLIESGVMVGASANTGVAFNVGTWNESGITLKLINNGYIVGKGGEGGNGGVPANNGADGGDAFYTREDITVTNNGTIGGGGGGGAGYSGAGGGGGAGYWIGIGGTASNASGNSGTLTLGGAGGWYIFSLLFVSGGAGGNLGVAGTQAYTSGTGGTTYYGTGGSPGVAVDGDSYVTWDATGTISGSQIN